MGKNRANRKLSIVKNEETVDQVEVNTEDQVEVTEQQDLGPTQEETNALDKHLEDQVEEPKDEITGTEIDIKDHENWVNEMAEAKAEPEAKSRRSPVADNAVITVLAETNPKRPGSQAHARFENYKSGITVAQALEAGVRRDDLAWDSRKGFITIEAVEEPQAA